MSWRDKARPIIARVIKEVGMDDPKALKAALFAAYPFGPREYHPYKIWLDEIRVQLGRKPVIDPKNNTPVLVPLPGQQELF